MFTLYTPQTANKALPEVRRLFSNILTYKKQAVALQEQVLASIRAGGYPHVAAEACGIEPAVFSVSGLTPASTLLMSWPRTAE